MHRLWAAGAAVLVCLALGGFPAVAQDDETDDATPAVVTGSETCFLTSNGTTVFQGDTARTRDRAYRCWATLSDERVIGEWLSTYSSDCVGDDCVLWGTRKHTAVDAAWTCWWVGMDDPSGRADGLILDVCTGDGAHAGWSYVSYQSLPTGTDVGNGSQFDGLIYQGSAPPSASLPAPADE